MHDAVVGPIVIEAWRIGDQGPLRRKNGRKFIVIALDQLQGVLRYVAILSDNGSDRSANVSNAIANER